MNVHLVIRRKNEDYHGSYDEVIFVYEDKVTAKEMAAQREENETESDVEYFVDTFPVVPKIKNPTCL